MKISLRKLASLLVMSSVGATSGIALASGHTTGGSSNSSGASHTSNTASVTANNSVRSTGNGSSKSNIISNSIAQPGSGNLTKDRLNVSSQVPSIPQNSTFKTVNNKVGNTQVEHRLNELHPSLNLVHEAKHHENANAAERLKDGHLDHIVSAKSVHDLDLKQQFQLHAQGDVARRLNFADELAKHGGWGNHQQGVLSPGFHLNGIHHNYFGPGMYNQFCFFPHWSPWVNWCWNFQCLPWWDPRPICCRPIFYLPCNPWIVWTYPVWCELPVCYCGTWVDVPVVHVSNGIDVQLLAVRFVDGGHPEHGAGPRYRVYFRNNSTSTIQQPFDVLAYASNSELPAAGMPQSGVRVSGIGAGEVQSVDLRLPADVSSLNTSVNDQVSAFRFLHVIVDARRELIEIDKTNNGAVLAREKILPVDPAIFSAALNGASDGSIINIAGEGLGPEAGRVVVTRGGTEIPVEIQGWYDLGVQIRLPKVTAEEALKADVTVIRGDRAASNPAHVKMPAVVAPAPMPVQ